MVVPRAHVARFLTRQMKPRIRWDRWWDVAVASPFIQPRGMVISMATGSGVLMALGAGLILTLFDGGFRRTADGRQLAGAVLLLGCVFSSAAAVLLQSWDSWLEHRQADRADKPVLRLHFRSQPGLAAQLWFCTVMTLACIVVASIVLIELVPRESGPGRAPTPNHASAAAPDRRR